MSSPPILLVTARSHRVDIGSAARGGVGAVGVGPVDSIMGVVPSVIVHSGEGVMIVVLVRGGGKISKHLPKIGSAIELQIVIGR